MFFQNVGYRWPGIWDATSGNGFLFLPAGNDRLRFLDSLPDSQRLFDPQLYLSSLDVKSCLPTCSRLATYSWFGIDNIPNIDDFGGKKLWQAEVEKIAKAAWTGNAPGSAMMGKACEDAIRFQIEIGCAFIICPAPLIMDRDDEATVAADWLDAGIEAAAELDAASPLIATVAISEGTLNEGCFAKGGFLETVIDQITSRESLDGVYIVIAQTKAIHPFESNAIVTRAYMALVDGFRRAGVANIFTNFADVLGLACLGLGGTGFATGASQSVRRLSLDGFLEKGGGLPLPHYYAHKVIGELLSETDMNAIRDKKLLRRVWDATPYSKDLLDALDQKRSAAEIAAWAQSKNNMAAAQRHFLARMASESERLSKLAGSDRATQIRNWLEDADVNATYLSSKITIEGRLAPIATWMNYFDSFVS